MEKINTQYEDMLRAITERGTHKSDRTGTGTTSIFGYQTRFDLAEEFPLVTTKKVFTRGAAEELFWFLRGSINSHDLEDINVNIWKEWADENGELGPVYGYVWRYAPTHFYEDIVLVKKKEETLDENDVPKYEGEGEPPVYGVGWFGPNGGRDVPERVRALWGEMMEKCYWSGHDQYEEFGGAGVTVHPAWHSLEMFAKTLHRLPLYPLWKENLKGYELNHDYYGARQFSPNTSIFLPTVVVESIGYHDGSHAVEAAGKVFLHDNAAAEWMYENSVMSDAKTLVAEEGFLYRPQVYVDQVEWLLNEIKTNPDSRRLIISAWNPALVDRQALPPCHTLFQFYVADGKLSCQLYQRSLDTVLGCPFNYVGYALFVHMLAQQTGLEVGEFIHTIGDAHIYDNHKEQVAEQLSREVRKMPKLELNKADDLYSYKFEDIKIVGYDPHPPIKAPVAV